MIFYDDVDMQCNVTSCSCDYVDSPAPCAFCDN